METPDGRFWMSPIEVELYNAMLNEGLSPVPQFQIEWYTVDFAFPGIRLAIEADGAVHRQKAQHDHDWKRDRVLHRKGWTVKRFHGTTIHRRASNCAIVIKKEVEMRQSIQRIHARQNEIKWDRRRKLVLSPFTKVANLLKHRKT